jgi:hypothetical protein
MRLPPLGRTPCMEFLMSEQQELLFLTLGYFDTKNIDQISRGFPGGSTPGGATDTCHHVSLAYAENSLRYQ